MKKLLITGASGFLGWHTCQQAKETWEVYGTYQSRSIAVPDITPIPLNLTDFEALKSVFQTLQPDAVIHTAAQSNPNQCQTDPGSSYRINVTTSWNIAGLCADAQIPCAFTSTDMVFDGQAAPYRETDPVSPINHYGEQKIAAENGMLARYPATAICRMPLMFGAAPAPSFLQPFLKTLREGQELRLFVDEFRTPASGTTAAKGLLLALEKVQGLVHLGGEERISRYEFGQLMIDVFGLAEAKLAACEQADVPMPAPRPPDVSLDSSYAVSLGYKPGTVREELEALVGCVQTALL